MAQRHSSKQAPRQQKNDHRYDERPVQNETGYERQARFYNRDDRGPDYRSEHTGLGASGMGGGWSSDFSARNSDWHEGGSGRDQRNNAEHVRQWGGMRGATQPFPRSYETSGYHGDRSRDQGLYNPGGRAFQERPQGAGRMGNSYEQRESGTRDFNSRDYRRDNGYGTSGYEDTDQQFTNYGDGEYDYSSPGDAHNMRDSGRFLPWTDREEGNMRGGRTGRSALFKSPKGYTRSDERIKEDVCDRIGRLGAVDPSDVEVNVKDGEVTLTGTISQRSWKHLIEDTVDDIAGVKEIHNQLRVASASSTSRSQNANHDARDDKFTSTAGNGAKKINTTERHHS